MLIYTEDSRCLFLSQANMYQTLGYPEGWDQWRDREAEERSEQGAQCAHSPGIHGCRSGHRRRSDQEHMDDLEG